MSEKELLLHAVVERERGKVEDIEAAVREIIIEMRAEGDRLFEKHGASEARPVWKLVQRLERSLRLSKVRNELAPA